MPTNTPTRPTAPRSTGAETAEGTPAHTGSTLFSARIRGRHRKPRHRKLLLAGGGLALTAGALSLVRLASDPGPADLGAGAAPARSSRPPRPPRAPTRPARAVRAVPLLRPPRPRGPVPPRPPPWAVSARRCSHRPPRAAPPHRPPWPRPSPLRTPRAPRAPRTRQGPRSRRSPPAPHRTTPLPRRRLRTAHRRGLGPRTGRHLPRHRTGRAHRTTTPSSAYRSSACAWAAAPASGAEPGRPPESSRTL